MKKKPRIVFVCTEDWFFSSHFRPLAAAAHSLDQAEVTLIARLGSGGAGLDRTGLHLIPFDFTRRDLRLLPALSQVWRLNRLLRREQPDIVHIIGLKPIVVAGLAAITLRNAACVYQLVGQGFAGISRSRRIRVLRAIAFRIAAFLSGRERSWLIVENPDDRDLLAAYGRRDDERVSVFGGAGVDPAHFAALRMPKRKRPRIGFVGRMIWSKGVDVLVAAMEQVKPGRAKPELHLYGEPDPGNVQSYSAGQLQAWDGAENTHWHGFQPDIREVWRNADIAVVPSRGGEGLPRAMLEAAACGRPLIVSDVSGCRHFVRDGKEGLIVPPDDPEALARAIEKLAGDRRLRTRMGKAARERVIEGYTEAHARTAAVRIYRRLLGETAKGRP